MTEITQTKLNESYSIIEGPIQSLKEISDFLKVERPGAFFEIAVQKGFKSPFHYFTKMHQGKLLVMNGHLQFLGNFGIRPIVSNPEFTNEDIDEFLEDIYGVLPFKPYDFQIKAFRDSILNKRQINRMSTSSGKSLTISLIAEFLRRKGKRGLLLVPNISLLVQFSGDIEEYDLKELHEGIHIIGGGQNIRHFDSVLTISTWQSLYDSLDKVNIKDVDYIICDEMHLFAGESTSEVIKATVNCEYRLGFTGTLPECPIKKMELIGMINPPKTYITARDLIDRGLGCPIEINTIILDYSKEDRKIFAGIQASGRGKNKFPNQLQFIKEHEQRGNLITSIITKISKTGNTLALFQHTEHGKQIFADVMKDNFPGVIVENKNITGKKSFEFQEQYNIYFLNGEDDKATREKTRKILEEKTNAILVANTALMSTGVSIKNLRNLVLASPMKSYTTVTQSLGRLMRLHKDKKVAKVFDIVDDLGFRQRSGIFFKQYQHRLKTSYHIEEHPVREITHKLN